jgi:response regulator RpfG family c-di-GMP phosphodiesterase
MTGSTGQPSWPQWQGASIRIIVVDDAPLIHEALRAILRRTNSYVIVGFALSLGEGARQVTKHNPDLVVCEIAIAGENGPPSRPAPPRTSSRRSRLASSCSG